MKASIRLRTAVAWVLAGLLAASAAGQSPGSRRGGGREPRFRGEGIPTPTREIFPGNRYTFTRVRYQSHSYRQWGWETDYPDSDVNFSQRLGELTTIEINRDENGEIRHIVIDLLDDNLFDYPILYIVEPGRLEFSDEEAPRLRDYLDRGGFLHVDDFWGVEEWENWAHEIGKVFPPAEFPIVDIPLSHEIFHCVFEIKEVPQVPSIHAWYATGLTYERYDAKEPHCRGIFDREGRLMVVMTHNTDLGDGWEREGENEEYFREFSAPKAYPLGVNIVVYAMTH